MCYGNRNIIIAKENFIGEGLVVLSSSRNCLIHKTSLMRWATILSSTSSILLATTFCILLCQVTRLPPTKVQYPEVDLYR